jgi:uncharacterized small protein (DUF1192 family)
MTAQEIADQAIRSLQGTITQLDEIRTNPSLAGGAGTIATIPSPTGIYQNEITRLTQELTRANDAVGQISNRVAALEAENGQLKKQLADARQTTLA